LAAGVVAVCLLPSDGLAVAILVLTLIGSGAFLVATRPTAVPDPWDLGPFRTLDRRAPDVVRAGSPDGRLLALRDHPRLTQVGSNYGSLWGLQSLNGIGPLAQWRQLETVEFADATMLANLVRQWGTDPVAVVRGSALEQRLVAAGFRATARTGGLTWLASGGPPVRRYVLAPRVRGVSAAAAIEAARTGDAMTETSLLVETTALIGGHEGDPNGRIEVLREHARGAVLRVAVDRPTWLAARQPYYRNWRATVDGRSATIHPAGGFFLGFLVERGQHEVVLTYEEPGLLPGVVVATLTAVLLPGLLRRAAADEVA
jgi:hypothetical protein